MFRTRQALSSLFESKESSDTKQKFGSFATTEHLELTKGQDDPPSFISKFIPSPETFSLSHRSKVILASTGAVLSAIAFVSHRISMKEKEKWNKFLQNENNNNNSGHHHGSSSEVNYAQKWFIFRCDEALKEYFSITNNSSTTNNNNSGNSFKSSLYLKLPLWAKMSLWSKLIGCSNSDTTKNNKNNKNKSEDDFVVVVLSEHTQLPSTSCGANQASARIVEVALPVRGEISIHTYSYVSPTTTKNSTKSSENPHQAPSLAQPQGSSFDPLASLSSTTANNNNNDDATSVNNNNNNNNSSVFFLRLLFQRNKNSSSSNNPNPLQKLIFAEGSCQGNALNGEDPQDLRVEMLASLLNNNNTTIEENKEDDESNQQQQQQQQSSSQKEQIVARYECESQEDDAGFPLISVDKNAKLMIMPSTTSLISSSSSDDESNKNNKDDPTSSTFIPNDVLLQKTFLHRNLTLTIFRALTKSFGGITDFINNSTSSTSNQKTKLNSLFLIVTTVGRATLVSAHSNNKTVPQIVSSSSSSSSSKLYSSIIEKVEAHYGSMAVNHNKRNNNSKSSSRRRTNNNKFDANNHHQNSSSPGLIRNSQDPDFAQKHFVFSLHEPKNESEKAKTLSTSLERTTSDPNRSSEVPTNYAAPRKQPTTSKNKNNKNGGNNKKKHKKNKHNNNNQQRQPNGAINGTNNDDENDEEDDDEEDEEDMMFVDQSAMNKNLPFSAEELDRADKISSSTSIPRMFRFNADFAFEHRDYVPKSFLTHSNDQDDDDDDFQPMKSSPNQRQQQSSPNNNKLKAAISQNNSNHTNNITKVTLCWSVLGESSSGVHLRRCRKSNTVDDENQENVRVLRESWFTVDVDVSF